MKYNLKSIMKMAWKIQKSNARNIFSLCLKMAWKIVKSGKKKEKFEGYLEMEISKNSNTMYSFKSWEGHGKRRIYCNYRNKRSAGYIDLDHDNTIIAVDDCKACKNAMEEFMELYDFA